MNRSRSKELNECNDFDFIDNCSPDYKITEKENKDSIAEPLYNLFEEIFELKDAKWFRKTIIGSYRNILVFLSFFYKH